jgi:predicted ATPase
MSENTLLAPSARYLEGVAAHRWESDPTQLALLAEFDRMHAALCAAPASESGLFGRLKSLLGSDDPPAPVPGLYLWGTVGRGKTFLMDLFAASLPHGVVLRRHFHRFMGEIHESLRALGEQQSPLVEVAAAIAARCRVLCLDEFLVNDIGDAMILANLLDALFARGVSLVTTSNTAPAKLYLDGLQRARFLPAIALIEQQCHVVQMASSRDWRLRALTQASVYHIARWRKFLPASQATMWNLMVTCTSTVATFHSTSAPTACCGSSLPPCAKARARSPTTSHWPRPGRRSSFPTCRNSPSTAKTRRNASCNWSMSSTTAT